MQTPERITVRTARKADHKSDRETLSLRSKPAKKDYSAQRCCNSFLKTTFKSSVPSFIIKDCGKSTFNIITQENYEFLRDSYFRYAELSDVKAVHTPGRTLNESINDLYRNMQEILPDNTGLNIEMHDGRLHFTLWKSHKWGHYLLYYFPVKFMDRVNKELRHIALSFFNRFMHANGIRPILDFDEHKAIIDGVFPIDGPDDTDEDNIGNKEYIELYRSGKIDRLFKRIENTSYHKDIYAALKGYHPANEWESLLVDAMCDGIQLLNPDKSIMEYSYVPSREDEPDIYPVSLERQICLVYDNDDIVTETIIDFINSDMQQSYEIVPMATLALTPRTESLFKVTDDYPERFFKWADKFIYIINSYKDD